MSLCLNKSYTALVMSTPVGYKLFDLVDTIYPDYITKLRRDCEIPQCRIRMIPDFLDNFVGCMIMQYNPKQLVLWDFDHKHGGHTFRYQDNILAAKISETLVIAFFLDKFLIHDYSDNFRYEICLPPNPKGICAFVSTNKMSLIAYPSGKGYDNMFRVVIRNAVYRHHIVTIPSFEHSIGALAFSPSGIRIAVTCKKGYAIYVYSSETGHFLHGFSRGNTCVTISSLAFSKDETFLAASSNTGTVHVFKLHRIGESLPQKGVASFDKPIMLPQGRNGAGSMCGIKGDGNKFRLVVTLPPHLLYVHYTPDCFGISNGLYKLYKLLEMDETEIVRFSSTPSDDDDDVASCSAIEDSV